MQTWKFLAVMLAAYFIFSLVKIGLVVHFLFKKKKMKSSNFNELDIYVIVPLLREQERINQLFEQSLNIISKRENVKFVYITTEREVDEGVKSNESIQTTRQIVSSLINSSCNGSKYFHFHFPTFNNVVAEQLNYGVNSLISSFEKNRIQKSVLVFFNADSKIDLNVFDHLGTENNSTVYQQSSLFTANLKKLNRDRNYFALCAGIYQSVWTLKHEIPRYLVVSNQYKIIPKRLSNWSLNYCITHGLAIPAPIFIEINGFPLNTEGGEDLAIGYVLRSYGYKIHSIPILENSDTPRSFRSWWYQMANWFIAVLGYFHFHKHVWKSNTGSSKVKLILLSLQGIKDAVFWICKGFLIVGFLALGIMYNKTLPTVCLLLLNLYIGLIVFFIVNRSLPKPTFPGFPSLSVIIILVCFPIVTVIRSLPAFLGLFWGFQISIGKPFIRKKTE